MTLHWTCSENGWRFLSCELRTSQNTPKLFSDCLSFTAYTALRWINVSCPVPVLCLILICFPVCSVFFAKVTLVVVGYFAFFPCVVSWLFLYDCQYQCKCDLLETVVSKMTCNTLIGIGDAKLNSHSLIQQMTQWAYWFKNIVLYKSP